MNEEKSKAFQIKEWLLKNSALFITSMIPVSAGIVTLLGGIYKRMYLEQYYRYFNIDMRYVSVGYYWNLSNTAVAIFGLFIIFFCLYMLYIFLNEIAIAYNNFMKLKADKSIFPKVVKYYKWKTVRQIIGAIIALMIVIFFICFYGIGIYGLDYDEYGNPRLLKEVLSSAWDLSAYIYILITGAVIITIEIYFLSKKKPPKRTSKTEKDYKRIFPMGIKNEAFNKQQMEAISKYYDDSLVDEEELDKRHTPIIRVILILALCLFLLSDSINDGRSDAINQREFLVTEDNRYVAIPISADRYALIDIKEEGDSLTLLIGKQNFSESNNFPCTRKKYKEVRKEFIK